MGWGHIMYLLSCIVAATDAAHPPWIPNDRATASTVPVRNTPVLDVDNVAVAATLPSLRGLLHLATRRSYSDCNLKFVKGYIEDIAGAGVAPGSIDLCVSNCVVNLSPDKPAVIGGVYDALREGGEFYFS